MASVYTGLHVGDANIDVLLQISRLPEPGQEAMVHALRIRAGGSATNTAVVLARWGIHARLLARIGRGVWARRFLQEIASLSLLDFSLLQQDAHLATGMVFVLVDASGERTFLTHRGANQHLKLPPLERVFHPRPRYLHLTGYSALSGPHCETASRLVEEAFRRDIPLVLDIGPLPEEGAVPVLRAWIAHATLLSLSEDAAQWLLGDARSPLAWIQPLAEQVPVVALRRGRQGAYLAWRGELVALPPLPVPAVDTTAAGDAFTAGLILGWLHQLPPDVAGWLAHLLGTLATTVWGGGPALPGPTALASFLDQYARHLPAAVLGRLRAWLTSRGQ